MKKLIYGIGFAIAIIIIAIYMMIRIPKNTEMNWYSSVKNFQSSLGDDFYDFYHPKSYFDSSVLKKTLSQIDNIRFYGTFKGQDHSYYFWFDENNDQFGTLKVKYTVSKNHKGYTHPQRSDYQLIDKESGIYYTTQGESDIELLHRYNSKHFIEVAIDFENKQNNDMKSLKDIALDMMKDSIQLNKNNEHID